MDPSLVERARDGDTAAFEALIGPRIEAMARMAMAIIGNEDEAREATQEAVLTTWRELPHLRDIDRFEAWAGRILVNRCRLTLRRQRRRSSREVPLSAEEPAHVLTRPGAPDDELIRRQALEDAFDRLTADDRTLLVLHHLEALPLAAIAERLGVPVGTVKSRLFAARQALTRALAGDR